MDSEHSPFPHPIHGMCFLEGMLFCFPGGWTKASRCQVRQSNLFAYKCHVTPSIYKEKVKGDISGQPSLHSGWEELLKTRISCPNFSDKSLDMKWYTVGMECWKRSFPPPIQWKRLPVVHDNLCPSLLPGDIALPYFSTSLTKSETVPVIGVLPWREVTGPTSRSGPLTICIPSCLFPLTAS